MYTNFRIQNFRGFKDLELKDLARVNLIAGKNNNGKTALLEAIFMYSNPYNPDLALNIYSFRGVRQFKIEFGRWADSPFDVMFHKFRTHESIVMSGSNKLYGNWDLKIQIVNDVTELNSLGIISHPSISEDDGAQSSASAYQAICFVAQPEDTKESKHYMWLDNRGNKNNFPIPPTPEFQGVFIQARSRTPHNINAERFTGLRLQGRHNLLFEALQIIEPRLIQLELLRFGGETVLHGDIGIGRPLPLPLMGDGINSIASLILAMSYVPDGVLFVDEVENGLHHSLHENIWKAIDIASKTFNVQVFATTHSREMLMAANEAFKEQDDYDFKLYRLDHDSETGDIEAVAYNERLIQSAQNMDFEVRG